MKTAVLIGLAIALASVQAQDEISNEKVKAAFIDGLKRVHASTQKIEGMEKGWDGSLPDSVGEIKTSLLHSGLNEQEAQAIVEGLANVAKNKDNPSWKTHYGNLYVQVLGAEKSLVEKIEQIAPDSIPADVNVAIDALKKVGLAEEHAQGHAKIVVWLRKTHV